MALFFSGTAVIQRAIDPLEDLASAVIFAAQRLTSLSSAETRIPSPAAAVSCCSSYSEVSSDASAPITFRFGNPKLAPDRPACVAGTVRRLGEVGRKL